MEFPYWLLCTSLLQDEKWNLPPWAVDGAVERRNPPLNNGDLQEDG